MVAFNYVWVSMRQAPEERAREIVEKFGLPENRSAILLSKMIETEFRKYEERIEGLRKALEFYADSRNYDIDIATSQNVSRRVILYTDQEERNQMSMVAGKRARKALSKDDEASK